MSFSMRRVCPRGRMGGRSLNKMSKIFRHLGCECPSTSSLRWVARGRNMIPRLSETSSSLHRQSRLAPDPSGWGQFSCFAEM